jgi:hypothetical protein
MTSVGKSLKSALSELQGTFSESPEALHLAVALVFSSIFRANGVDVVVVGGQAASHWLRVVGSTDTDFVTTRFHTVRDTLLDVGFVVSGAPFRLIHAGADVLIELVGETIQVAGIQADAQSVITVRRSDIAHQAVSALMPGPASVIDPALVFLNYAEASLPNSDWHDFEDNGTQAHERALALLALYRPIVTEQLNRFAREERLRPDLQQALASTFQLYLTH